MLYVYKSVHAFAQKIFSGPDTESTIIILRNEDFFVYSKLNGYKHYVTINVVDFPRRTFSSAHPPAPRKRTIEPHENILRTLGCCYLRVRPCAKSASLVATRLVGANALQPHRTVSERANSPWYVVWSSFNKMYLVCPFATKTNSTVASCQK